MAEKKVALITGANRGLGLETARQLGTLGYTVLLGCRDAERGKVAATELAASGIDSHFVHIDSSEPSTFSGAATTIEANYGRLDVLVNNAGMLEDFGQSIEQVSPELWRRTFEINFFAVIELTTALLPLIRKSAAGRIVNVSSILASLTFNSDPRSPISGWRSPAYNASKTALNAFTALLATELADTLIKVNSAHPGWVKTEVGGDGATMDVQDGAKTSVALATLDANGPTGAFIHQGERLPW